MQTPIHRLRTTMDSREFSEMFGKLAVSESSFIVVDDGYTEATYYIGDADPPEFDPCCVSVMLSIRDKETEEPVALNPAQYPGWYPV